MHKNNSTVGARRELWSSVADVRTLGHLAHALTVVANCVTFENQFRAQSPVSQHVRSLSRKQARILVENIY